MSQSAVPVPSRKIVLDSQFLRHLAKASFPCTLSIDHGEKMKFPIFKFPSETMMYKEKEKKKKKVRISALHLDYLCCSCLSMGPAHFCPMVMTASWSLPLLCPQNIVWVLTTINRSFPKGGLDLTLFWMRSLAIWLQAILCQPLTETDNNVDCILFTGGDTAFYSNTKHKWHKWH